MLIPASNNSLDPGGQFQFPTALNVSLLYLKFQPRYSIFLESDIAGSFIVDAAISHTFGQAYKNITYNPPKTPAGPFSTLEFEIFSEESGALLVSNSIPVNSTGNIIEFSFSSSWTQPSRTLSDKHTKTSLTTRPRLLLVPSQR